MFCCVTSLTKSIISSTAKYYQMGHQKSLTSILLKRQNWKIPHETHTLHPQNWMVQTEDYMLHGAKDHQNIFPELKQFYKSTFYHEAPVPHALNLTKMNCQATTSYVDAEIESGLKSGCSLLYTNPTSVEKNKLEIRAIMSNLIWQRNDKYEVVGANAKSWHNAAAEIVHKSPHRNYNHLVWRQYQFQHIYDMGQHLLQKEPDKRYAFYCSTGSIAPEYRGGLGIAIGLGLLRPEDWHWSLNDCIVYTATTFSKLENIVKEHFKDFQQIDYVSYSEEQLVLDGNNRCFEPFEKLGGICFHVNFLKP